MVIEKPLRASNHCRHYSYKDEPTCALGISLALPGTSRRCMPDGGTICDSRTEYTEDERAVWRKFTQEIMVRVVQVLAEIPGSDNDAKDRKFWGQVGKFACPACNSGVVRWSRSRSNGHVHAACTTINCVAIMQ